MEREGIQGAIILVIIVILVLSVAALFLFNWAIFSDRSEFHKGLAHYEGLPALESDITVYRNRNISGTFAADFVALAKQGSEAGKYGHG